MKATINWWKEEAGMGMAIWKQGTPMGRALKEGVGVLSRTQTRRAWNGECPRYRCGRIDVTHDVIGIELEIDSRCSPLILSLSDTQQ